ncbi:MAG: hypothetical protein WCF81_22785 [Roseiarcus sp.]
MLDGLAATVENLWPRLQALGHAIEPGLVFAAGDGANVVRISHTTGSYDRFLDYRNRLGEIAQPAHGGSASATSRQGADVVARCVISKVVIVKRALARLDILSLEVAAVGDDVERGANATLTLDLPAQEIRGLPWR